MINGIDEDVYNYVNEVLDEIEKEFGVKILYAVESGSRGWGFANEDSDYDVRFIYVRPLEDYLSIVEIRDVIDMKDLGKREYKYDLDFSGWDVKKVLGLHRKSNSSLREHIVHKMVYRGDTHFLDGLPPFDPVRLKHSYGGMTYSNYKKYVSSKYTDDFSPRVIKTYCYCIRQILAWILIDEEGDVNAPINIDELLDRFSKKPYNIGDGILQDMRDLVEFYKSNCKNNAFNEKQKLRLDEFIKIWLDVMRVPQGHSRELYDIKIYNERFLRILLKQDFYRHMEEMELWSKMI